MKVPARGVLAAGWGVRVARILSGVASRSTPDRPPARRRPPGSSSGGSPRAAAGTRRGTQQRPGGARAATVTPGAARSGGRGGGKGRGRGRRRWLPSWKLVLGTVLAVAAIGLLGFYVAYRMIDIPKANDFAEAQTSVVYFADGTTELGRFSAVDRTLVGSDQIPQHVKDAIVAAEDRSFYENRGVSPIGLARAVWGQVTGDYAGGGSTISQQYVKNYYLTDEQTYVRKAKEAIISIKINQQQDKDEILTDYLNTIYFGRGAYGIQAASKAFFDKDVSQLTPEEGALLAGIVPSPSRWDPATNPEKAQDRFEYVLDGMVTMGTLPSAQREAMVVPATAGVQESQEVYRGPNGYLLSMVRSELLANSALTEAELDQAGLRITTTVDARLQGLAVDTMTNRPDVFPVADRPATLQSSLVTLDPQTGAVRALYGGADYLTRQSNAATQDVAQAGSTFKPFTLVAALENGISLKSTWDGRNNREFEGYDRPVRNFGGSSFGRITLERATANSVNTVYVDVNSEIGPDKTRDVAVRAGLPEDTAGLNDFVSNVLGTSSPHPIDMATAYATFASQGVRHTTHVVQSVTRAGSDEVVYAGPTEGNRVFAEDVMADTTAALEGVVQNGSGEYASRLDQPAAGKTGTSSDNQSAWFVGYTPYYATVVALYNVNPDGTPSSIPGFGGRSEITGGSFPVRIWTSYMEDAHEGLDEVDFPERADVGRQPTTSAPPATTTTAPPTTTTEPPPTTTEPPPTTTEPPPPPPEPTVTLPTLPPSTPPGDGGGGGGGGGDGGGGGGDGGGGVDG